MIHIVIVEDNKIIAEEERKCVEHSWNLEEAICVDIYENAEQLLEQIENNKKVDMLIADIELPGMNGIEMGKVLKAFQQNMAIIFLTAHEGFALESYKMDAEQYVLKSEMWQRLPQILNRVGKRIVDRKRNYRFVNEEGHMKKLDYEEVLYFEKEGKYVRYVMTSGEARERTSLENAIKEAGGFPFVKVERGYVVNARYISKITENTVFMINQDMIPVSRRLLPQVRKEITINRSRIY